MSRSLKIVVADDELDMRDYFQQILPLLGHQVIGVAQNGRELVDLCAATHPDLVITDIKMPDMDGIDAATEIYRRGARPGHLGVGLSRSRVHPPRGGGPHHGLPGQADQAGRPRAGDRDRDATGSSSFRRSARRQPI